MQLEFNKNVIPCLRRVTREVQNQEQTQEVRLNDGMPDIGKVLGTWGQVLIRSKEWRGSGVSVSGGVMAWVLYAPEEGGPVQCVESWIPFQMKWDFRDAERDGGILVQPLLRCVDARSTSARKLLVRAGIGILCEAMVDGEAEIYTPGDVPGDINLLKKSYPMTLPKEAGEKAFLIDETVPLTAPATGVDKILRYQVQPTLLEQKVMGDKVVFRGTADLYLVYLGTDGQLHQWELELPFSQFAELKSDYSTEAAARVWLAVTSVELEPGEEEGYICRTGMTGQYLICDRENVELVEDAYSNLRSVTPQSVPLWLPSVLDTQPVLFTSETEFDAADVKDAVFFPEHPRLYREGDQITAELGGVFQMLGSDEAGALSDHTGHWEGTKTLRADMSTKVFASAPVCGKLQSKPSRQGVTLAADLRIDTEFISGQEMPMVTGLEAGALTQPDPNRPSLILRKAGEDDLWQVAKETGSTVEAIMKANRLRQDPDPNQMLLIPVE